MLYKLNKNHFNHHNLFWLFDDQKQTKLGLITKSLSVVKSEEVSGEKFDSGFSSCFRQPLIFGFDTETKIEKSRPVGNLQLTSKKEKSHQKRHRS